MEAAADEIGLATLRAPARQHTISGFIRKSKATKEGQGWRVCSTKALTCGWRVTAEFWRRGPRRCCGPCCPQSSCRRETVRWRARDH